MVSRGGGKRLTVQEPKLGDRNAGKVDLQVGEEIVLEILGFRHIGSNVIKMVVISESSRPDKPEKRYGQSEITVQVI